jgi:hypothetical protein
VEKCLTGLAGAGPPITQIIAENEFRAKTAKLAKNEFPFVAFAPFARPIDLKIRAIREICG